jgi:hypothetical protein
VAVGFNVFLSGMDIPIDHFQEIEATKDYSLAIDHCNRKSPCILIWVNYNDLTATSLESWLIREIIPKWP